MLEDSKAEGATPEKPKSVVNEERLRTEPAEALTGNTPLLVGDESNDGRATSKGEKQSVKSASNN